MTEVNTNELSLIVGYDTDGPYLIGGHCNTCKEKFFPRQSICPRCTAQDIKETKLSRKGKLFTFTVVHQKPPDYAGPTPYYIGRVLLPEGVFVLTQLKVNDKSELKIDMEMELVVDIIYYDENGNPVKGFMFKPVESS